VKEGRCLHVLCHRSGIETHIVSLLKSRMDEGAWAYDHCRVLRHCSGVKIHINSLSYYQFGLDPRCKAIVVLRQAVTMRATCS